MTYIQKLSDRDNMIFEIIKLIFVNKGMMTPKQLQWELLQVGIYIKGTLLKQALSVMDEKGLLTIKPAEQKEEPKSNLVTDAVFSKES